jgi:plasmid maintenance system antidote protein VapI
MNGSFKILFTKKRKWKMNYALRLEIVRKFHTQADFAQAVGSDESAVSRTVRGRRKLTLAEADHWAELLGCEREILPVRAK